MSTDEELRSRQVMVGFAPHHRVRLREGDLVDLDGGADRAELRQLIAMGGWQRAYTVDEEFLDRARREAEEVKGARMPDLDNYLVLAAPADRGTDDVVEVLKGSPLVAFADTFPAMTPPSVPDYSGPLWPWYQRYLDPAPDGIDARWSWLGSGGSGAGVRVCVVEYGYNAEHVDLPPVTVIGPPAPGEYVEHGTSTLGVLFGRNDGVGVTGVVHDADPRFRYIASEGRVPFRVHDAVATFLNASSTGDVLLIEAQLQGPVPKIPGTDIGRVAVDWWKPYCDAIRIASAKLVVVEAAGNGSQWLDHAMYQQDPSHRPFSLSGRSGAIIVGAGQSAYSELPRARVDTSNYGTVVRLQGWGDRVVTTGYGTLYPGEDEEGNPPPAAQQNEFYNLYSGTSSASAVVAAAAAAVQGVHKAVLGYPLLPPLMEPLLRSTGTPPVVANTIGPLPDIRAAVLKVYADNGIVLPPPTADPVVSPESGSPTFPLAVSVVAGDPSQDGTVIRWTTDGSEPSYQHGSVIDPGSSLSLTLHAGVTLKALALRYHPASKRWYASGTVMRTWVGSTPVVATPKVVLPYVGVQYVTPVAVVLTCATPAASIRYRTDGTSISAFHPGTEYSGPIDLAPGEYALVVRAHKTDHYPSQQVKHPPITVIAPQLAMPVLAPAGGSFPFGTEVTLSHGDDEAELRYTTDGGNVQPGSPLYTQPFWLDSSATVRARAYRAGWQPSPTVHAGFEVWSPPAPPKIAPPRGRYVGSVEVSIGRPTGASTVRYTTDGKDPKYVSPEYVGPFTLGVGLHTVKAQAWAMEGSLQSTVASTVFRVRPQGAGA